LAVLAWLIVVVTLACTGEETDGDSGDADTDVDLDVGDADADFDAGSGPCDFGETLCGPICVDTSLDSFNCGECGSACPAGIACEDGVCVPAG